MTDIADVAGEGNAMLAIRVEALPETLAALARWLPYELADEAYPNDGFREAYAALFDAACRLFLTEQHLRNMGRWKDEPCTQFRGVLLGHAESNVILPDMSGWLGKCACGWKDASPTDEWPTAHAAWVAHVLAVLYLPAPQERGHQSV